MNPLYEVVTTSEVHKLWGLATSTIRWARRRGKFKVGCVNPEDDEARKNGREWLFLKSAMIRVYGEPKATLRQARRKKTKV